MDASIEWKWFMWLIPFVLFIIIVLLLRKRRQYRRFNESDSYRTPSVNERLSVSPQLVLAKQRTGISASRFRIISRSNFEDKKIEGDVFKKLVADSNAIEILMQALWSDSFVHSIFLTNTFIHSVNAYLNSYRTHPDEGINIEIGGFLLGRHHIHANSDQCDVLIETLVPIKSEENHNLHLEFNTRSLSAELGDAQDRFPDLLVIGWFHTHPGHGLFLSKPDLAIQTGFFNEKFQLAMEIDSMTEALDLAFFTYKQSGEINNSELEQRWLSWRHLENTA